ncbi:tRNA lysidine(34) synthetase TilS [Sediminibacterium ginsengisoli]|uniref:tRNA(Ile)-lysidine synthase n=1 Tax=Sediminibacterium ginsengisoli TaxID=413434 RepID=A0A1T4R478_9BACT|nr:tRNA lysidine(34) synthetase TilS [Sediminibacterium ginsengisoli]SKA10840.1 tRNA(Ile)-lysidine synthase [Sediminibacterium ginsengisoli]
MDLLQSFLQHWQQQYPALQPGSCRLLLAVSGGPDSMVMTDLLVRGGFDCTVLHCNFGLRGDESDRDEQVVKSLAAAYNVEVKVRAFDTKAEADSRQLSIQETARELRYEWFGAELNKIQAPAYIVTAHHADDNIETMLMRLFRGTGIRGLTGIPAFRKDARLLRPLLVFRKQQLLDHAAAHAIPFAEDSSNSTDKYTRNFFRNRLIPAVKEVYPNAEENLVHTIAMLNEATMLYEQSVNLQLNKLLEQKGNEWHIPVLKWQQAKPLQTITWEIIRQFGFSAGQTAEAIKLLGAVNGSTLTSPTHRLIRNRNWIIITTTDTDQAAHLLVEEPVRELRFPGGTLRFHTEELPLDETAKAAAISKLQENRDAGTVVFDADKVDFPLLVRKWKTGDYFYPLGMQKKKKLNRFFIDQKLSPTAKEQVWVLESNRKLIWIAGYRMDDRFKVTAATKRILKVVYLK